MRFVNIIFEKDTAKNAKCVQKYRPSSNGIQAVEVWHFYIAIEH